MASNFYKFVTRTDPITKNKVRVKVNLTRSQVKQEIMKANKWTAEQYRKQYDIFKNKLRAYESYQEAQGIEAPKESVVDLLFAQAKAKRLYGKKYKPSMKMQQIQRFKAYSITQGRERAKSNKRYALQERAKYGAYVSNRFGFNDGLVAKNAGAKKIYDKFIEDAKEKNKPINWVKLEKALADYADAMHAKEDDDGKKVDADGIHYGEVQGSPDVSVDFDIESYL